MPGARPGERQQRHRAVGIAPTPLPVASRAASEKGGTAPTTLTEPTPMPVGNATFPTMHPVRGFRLGTASAGIKKPGRKDLVIMAFDPGASVAACFTRNAFCAAPVQVGKAHLRDGADIRYLVTNTGNANAGTGERGLADARRVCEALAGLAGCDAAQILPYSTGVIGEPLPVDKILAALPLALGAVAEHGWARAGLGGRGLAYARRVCEALAGLAGCDAAQILPYSTGVIGEPLPVDKILAALPAALAALAENGWDDAGLGIMTTDTRPKGASLRVEIAGKPVTLTGIAKGAGMIKPNMATMLGYVATDARVDNALLQEMLGRAVERSFNRITIDGDTSTNDAVTLVATGASGVAIGPGEREAFQRALDQLCRELAQAIVRDGEGATKFVTVDVAGGATSGECLAVAYAVAESPLVKTALFASDPNWGRILAAIGRAGLADLDVAGVSVHLGDVLIADKGGRAPGYTEAAGQAVMDEEEITIRIRLGRGSAHETVWTTDLSHDYVTINAEYRT